MHGDPTGSALTAAPDGPVADRQLALVDLLDRLLTGGAVVTGDIVLSIAEVDLVHINLRAVIRSIGPDAPSPWGNADPADPEK